METCDIWPKEIEENIGENQLIQCWKSRPVLAVEDNYYKIQKITSLHSS